MFEEKCCGSSKEAQLTALCWVLGSIYQTLLDIMQDPQGEERENKVTDTAFTLTPTIGMVVTHTLRTGSTGEPENQPVLV